VRSLLVKAQSRCYRAGQDRLDFRQGPVEKDIYSAMDQLGDVLFAMGGLGMFLLGMRLLSSGLRTLAGETLRRAIRDYTATPLRGTLVGAAATGVLQSSAAVVVTAVGFVGAGLMSFPQALGVIFGANIGTTATGWIVALLGFRLDLGTMLMPGALLGMLLHTMGRGRWRDAGWPMTGFSLLFIGIAAMQGGLAGIGAERIFAVIAPDTFLGRLQLLGIGAIITLLTQSSSAGVAIALAALGAGSISFPQAAAMVIGMDIATTVTAILATIGASATMRRTGYSHLIYNLITGLMAFLLLTPLDWVVEAWRQSGREFDPQIGLVAFHTFFNTLGAVLMVGFTRPFARLVERLVPERGPPMTARLDDSLLTDPQGATDAAIAALDDIASEQFRVLQSMLARGAKEADTLPMRAIGEAVHSAHLYIENIRLVSASRSVHARLAGAIHALDHIERLHRRCRQMERTATTVNDPALRELALSFDRALAAARADPDRLAAGRRIAAMRDTMLPQLHQLRAATIEGAAGATPGIGGAIARLDAIRWLDRASRHTWRIIAHLGAARAGIDLPAAEDAANGLD
jgi:phosphate:Na+ symporter